MRSTHRGAAIGGGTHRPRALRVRAKRQQRASRASLRGAALTARARQRSEAGRASASISNHALFTLSPPGHGLAAGGSNAGPQDSVRRPRAKHNCRHCSAASIDRDGPHGSSADAAAARYRTLTPVHTQVPREDPLDRHDPLYLPRILPDPHLWCQDGQIERPLLLDASHLGVEPRDADGARHLADYHFWDGDAVVSRRSTHRSESIPEGR